MGSCRKLIEALGELGLLPPEHCRELYALQTGDVRVLAKHLVKMGWFTVYQANQLILDRVHELVLGHYQILDKLGQGGLSQVYKARHRDLDLTVALKVIRPEILGNPEGRQQFLLEMEAMARLDHPNIVQFCDVDQAGDTFFFAMEYVEGTDLAKVVRLSGPRPIAEASDYIRQTALGLQHAHERNLVHRDIKPVNLFLIQPARVEAAPHRFQNITTQEKTRSPRGTVKILDWGLASLRCPRSSSTQQMMENISRGIIGTADYLSPEQARNALTVDIRGDIYSLGCTFYFLLTGQPPFPDGTLMQKIMQHQIGEPTPVDAFRGDVPAGVKAILKRMLAKRPEERFQTPAAVALALLPFAMERKPTPENLQAIKKPIGPAPSGTDNTPLPMALGGVPGEVLQRLPKAGPHRQIDHTPDTSCPQK